jgi:hypothetical protein
MFNYLYNGSTCTIISVNLRTNGVKRMDYFSVLLKQFSECSSSEIICTMIWCLIQWDLNHHNHHHHQLKMLTVLNLFEAAVKVERPDYSSPFLLSDDSRIACTMR